MLLPLLDLPPERVEFSGESSGAGGLTFEHRGLAPKLVELTIFFRQPAPEGVDSGTERAKLVVEVRVRNGRGQLRIDDNFVRLELDRLRRRLVLVVLLHA